MTAENIIVNSFQEVPVDEYPKIPLIVVYKQPTDFPKQYVARLWNVGKPTPYIVLGKKLKEVNKVIPQGMVGIQPFPDEDPTIVMTYI